MEKVKKRRIQPQMISPTQSGAAPAGKISATSTAAAALPDSSRNTTNAKAQESAWEPPSVKEDSEAAATLGWKNRRLYVELNASSQEVNWKKMLKAAGVAEPGGGPAAQPSSDIMAPILPGFPLLSRQGVVNPLTSVIARLERQYRAIGHESSDDEETFAPAKLAGARDSNEESGNDSGADNESNPSCGEYDYEDNFLDDSEFADFVEGDRRKPKHSGFFINKGEIEKTDEEIPLAPDDSPPKKKRARRARVSEDEAEKVDSDREELKKRRKLESPIKVVEQSKKDGTGISELLVSLEAKQKAAANDPTASQPRSLATQAAAAGKAASAKPQGSSELNTLLKLVPPVRTQKVCMQPSTSEATTAGASKELQEALAGLEETARAAKIEEQLNPATSNSIPRSLNAALTPFACLLAKELDANPGARDALFDRVALLFEPLYSKSKLSKRLEALAKATKDEHAVTVTKLKEHIDAKIKAAEEKLGQSEGQPAAQGRAPENFMWDKHMENHLSNFVKSHNKLNGRPLEAMDIKASLKDVLGLWPSGRMSLEVLEAALERGKLNPKTGASSRQPRKSVDSSDAPPAGNNSQDPKSQPSQLPRIIEGEEAQLAAAPPSVPPTKQHSAPASQKAAPANTVPTYAMIAGPTPSAPSTAATIAPIPAAEALTDTLAVPAPSPVQSLPKIAGDTVGATAAPAHQQGAFVEPAEVALRNGADPTIIVESIKLASTTKREIINKVLMCAGPGGYTSQEILDKANELGLTGSTPWDKSKKHSIPATIRTFKYTVAIGFHQYAHLAFPGVKALAEREEKIRKKAKEEQEARRNEQAKESASQPGPEEAATTQTVIKEIGNSIPAEGAAASLESPVMSPREAPTVRKA